MTVAPEYQPPLLMLLFNKVSLELVVVVGAFLASFSVLGISLASGQQFEGSCHTR